MRHHALMVIKPALDEGGKQRRSMSLTQTRQRHTTDMYTVALPIGSR